MEIIENYQLEETPEKEDIFEDIVEPKTGILHWIRRFFISDKKIGELNGRWAALFKLVLFMVIICIPTFFTWGIWVTTNIYSSKFHIERSISFEDRITELEKTDVSRATLSRQIEQLNDKLDNWTPSEWERRISELEKNTKELGNITTSVDKTNSIEHAQINAKLELILKELKSDGN